MRVLAYTRVSTEEQGESRLGLDAQRAAIESECARRGWTLLEVVEEVASAKRADKRPQLQELRERLKTHGADVLVVSHLDRLTRSVLDFATVVDDAQRQGWSLVVVEQSFDLSTSNGRAMAGMLAVFAQFERDLISERITNALAVARARGVKLGGRRVPERYPPEIPARVLAARRAGRSFASIAREFNAEGVPTAHHGRCWYPSSVRAVSIRVLRAKLAKQAAA